MIQTRASDGTTALKRMNCRRERRNKVSSVAVRLVSLVKTNEVAFRCRFAVLEARRLSSRTASRDQATRLASVARSLLLPTLRHQRESSGMCIIARCHST